MSGPVDTDAERQVLGVLLKAPALARERPGLGAHLFADPRHRALADAALAYISENGATAAAGVRHAMAASLSAGPWLGDVDPVVELAALETIGDPEELDGLIVHLAKLHAQRETISVLEQALAAVAKPGASPRTIVGSVIAGLDRATSSLDAGERRGESFREVSEDIIANFGKRAAAVPTGLPDADRRLNGGFRPGELIVAAGRPGIGKTILGAELAINAARAGVGVLLFSLEVSAIDMTARLLASLTYERQRLEFGRIISDTLIDEERNLIREVAAEFRCLPITIRDRRGLTVDDIVARMRIAARSQAHTDHRLGLVIVDYVGIVAPTGRYRGQRTYEIAEVTSGLREAAGELGAAVIALAQISRGVEGREDKRPDLSDIRDSGSLEQDADAVMLLYRPEMYLLRKKDDAKAESDRIEKLGRCRNTLEIIIAKARRAEPGTVRAFIDAGANAIRPLAPANGGVQ